MQLEQKKSKTTTLLYRYSFRRVTVDTDTWHRVRIGPITNLQKLEETRSKLRAAQIEALVIRVGE